jgi:triphosphoribosyl-dephospho-CoA synthetase
MTMFSEIDIQLIQREMQSKSAADIAFLLDVPVDDVKTVIKDFSAKLNVETRQAALDQLEAKRSARRREIVKVAKPKKEKAKEFTRVIEKSTHQKKNYLETRNQYKTKQVDYSSKKMVQIDKGTWIYITDESELTAEQHKYYQNIKTKNDRLGEDVQEILRKVKQKTS